VSAKQKRVTAIRNHPKDVRFDDACRVAQWLGFVAKASGGTSHHAFARPGEATGLNFQNRGGKIPAYQARQLIVMIDKYEEELL